MRSLGTRRTPLWVVLAALLLKPGLLSAVAGAAENLVYNGGFEEASEQNPPPGWVLWGGKAGRIPANFTRDTQNPHSGKACLRITHPAGAESNSH